MGVPLVTMAGHTPVGRGGVSQLKNLGFSEWIARTPEEFAMIASKLAGNLPELKNLRAILRVCMKRSPLMDDRGYTRSIEAAYRAMWEHWCLQ